MLFCYELGNAVLIAVFQQLEYAAVLVVDVIEHVHGVLLYRIGVDLAQQFVFCRLYISDERFVAAFLYIDLVKGQLLAVVYIEVAGLDGHVYGFYVKGHVVVVMFGQSAAGQSGSGGVKSAYDRIKLRQLLDCYGFYSEAFS